MNENARKFEPLQAIFISSFPKIFKYLQNFQGQFWIFTKSFIALLKVSNFYRTLVGKMNRVIRPNTQNTSFRTKIEEDNE